MCPIRHFVYTFFNPVFQVSTAKNEINLFNNHILIVAPVTFAPAGAMTPSAEFLFYFFLEKKKDDINMSSLIFSEKKKKRKKNWMLSATFVIGTLMVKCAGWKTNNADT